MLLIFGGTTEGKKIAAVCDEAGKSYYYSTKENYQKIESAHGIVRTGNLDSEALELFCEEKNIQLIINGAHPFAETLHQNISIVSQKLNIPVIRYERQYPQRDADLHWFDSYEAILHFLTKNPLNSLLALTGVNTIAKLKPYWSQHNCIFRILEREESLSIAKKEGFPMQNLIFYESVEKEETLFAQLKPQAILTKESGNSGGFNEKILAAKKLGIPVLVIKKPILDSTFISVNGEYGLRKEIEKKLPDFFPLKTGYTTGTCATAATKAALFTLLTKEKRENVNITLPNGEQIQLAIAWTRIEENAVSCGVVKDAGDDPDITNGQEIISTVQLNLTETGVHFLHGKGVGTVTLPGLGIPIGEPAINATPRKMIEQEIQQLLIAHQKQLPTSHAGVNVTISVPDGEKLALKTFNPKLGITGGISIIGTSGIVKPFSSEAFIESIHREMNVAKALDCKHLVINSGAKSERYIKAVYPAFLSQAFIHYGNFIGETIKLAAELEFEELTLGIMLGKAVKLAEGHLDTHSKKTIMNKDFLVKMAREANYSEDICEKIQQITLARQLWEIIPDTRFFSLLIQKCHKVCNPLFPQGKLLIFLIDEEGKIMNL